MESFNPTSYYSKIYPWILTALALAQKAKSSFRSTSGNNSALRKAHTPFGWERKADLFSFPIKSLHNFDELQRMFETQARTAING